MVVKSRKSGDFFARSRFHRFFDKNQHLQVQNQISRLLHNELSHPETIPIGSGAILWSVRVPGELRSHLTNDFMICASSNFPQMWVFVGLKARFGSRKVDRGPSRARGNVLRCYKSSIEANNHRKLVIVSEKDIPDPENGDFCRNFDEICSGQKNPHIHYH